MKVKTLTNRKELRSALKQAKFFTFDQEGKCKTWFFSKCLCKVVKLDERLQERVSDKFGRYFNGPQYLYIFPGIPEVRKFIEVNLPRYEEYVCQPYSSEMAYTLLLALATSDIMLQYDFQFLKVYKRHKEEGVIPELQRWRTMNQCLQDMLLVTNQFIYKS